MKKTNTNNTTELVFILDKSGSMAGMEGDTVGGFNAMMEKQKGLEGKAYVSTVLFSNESEVLHDRLPIDRVPKLTEGDYCVGGCTALLDAVGDAIHHIGNIHKYARAEDVPDRTMFIITTDGMENASTRYTAEKVKEMIRRQEKEYGWEFIFAAANIDAVETASQIGIRKERAANYTRTEEGTADLYRAVGHAVSCMRVCAKVDDSWSEELNRSEKRK